MLDKASIELINTDHYRLSGSLDFENVVVLYQSAKTIIDQANNDLRFDLSATQHKSSAGLALLISLLRYAKQKNIHLHYTHLPTKLLSVAKISNLDKLITR